MSLYNIKLPDIVIADLYSRSLIEDNEAIVHAPTSVRQTAAEQQPATPAAVTPGPAIVETKEARYKVLGKNLQHIAIIVHCADEVYLPEADLQFLTKMLGACKLNMADVAIVNHATSEVAIDRLKEQLQPKYVLLFGVEPTAIQL